MFFLHIVSQFLYTEQLALTPVICSNIFMLFYASYGSDGKESVEDPGLNPGSGRSPGGGHGNPLQYSCLKNSMDRGTWWATVHGSDMT